MNFLILFLTLLVTAKRLHKGDGEDSSEVIISNLFPLILGPYLTNMRMDLEKKTNLIGC